VQEKKLPQEWSNIETISERGMEFPSLVISKPWLTKALNNLIELA